VGGIIAAIKIDLKVFFRITLFKYQGDPQNTVLIEAVKNGNLDILNFLIAEGSDLDLKANPAAAIVENAIKSSIEPFYSQYVRRGINHHIYTRVSGDLVEDGDILGMNALDIALKFNNLKSADLLLRNGAKPSPQPAQAVSNTMLTQHTYAQNNNYDVESGEVGVVRENRSCRIL
jgi:ankyrin repeat protein